MGAHVCDAGTRTLGAGLLTICFFPFAIDVAEGLGRGGKLWHPSIVFSVCSVSASVRVPFQVPQRMLIFVLNKSLKIRQVFKKYPAFHGNAAGRQSINSPSRA